MPKKIKTFQDHKYKFFIFGVLVGAYPPGSSAFLKKKSLQWLFYIIALCPWIGCLINGIGILYYMIFYPVDDILIIIQLFRRMIVMFYIFGRIHLHILRYKKTDQIFKEWEDKFNNAYLRKKRNDLLEVALKNSTKAALFGIAIRFLMSTLYNIPFMLDRHVRSSELCGWPHDKNSPYHFYYVAFQVILFIWGGLTFPTIELYGIYLCTMMQTELVLMREQLKNILRTITIENDELIYHSPKGPTPIEYGGQQHQEISEKVYIDIKIWARKHIELLEWMDNFGDYTRPEITLKYAYLSVHCSLVVIGLTNMGGAAMVNDLVLTLVVTVGNFWVLFYGSRKLDDITQKCSDLFLDGYGENWTLYSLKVQKTLKLISRGVVNKEYEIRFLKIFVDNSECMMTVLQTAYNVLTFIMPMTAKE